MPTAFPVWMAWNAILAVVPLILAIALFVRPRAGRTLPLWPVAWWRALWCAGLLAFLAFLPNAPYVITDVVHLTSDLEHAQGSSASTLAVVVLYALLVGIGLAAYAASLALVRQELQRRSFGPAVVIGVELALHALCALGVLLGRYARFNSWELGTRFDDVTGHLFSRLDRPVSWSLLIGMFVVLVAGATCMRAFGVGLLVEWRALRRHD